MRIHYSDTSYSLSPLDTTMCVLRVDMTPFRKEKDKLLVSQLDALKSSGHPSNTSNVKSWHTGWDSHIQHKELTNELLFDIYTIITSEKILYSLYDFSAAELNDTNLLIRSSWFNIQEPGELVAEHNHGMFSDISFCYYLNVEEYSAPIRMMSYKSMQHLGCSDKTYVPFYPKNHELFIFSSLMYHDVPPTNSKRYTFAGNICSNVRLPIERSFKELFGEAKVS